MDLVRRVGGEMEPTRRPAGRRALLPAEAELCESLGLTEDDYWYFVDRVENYQTERPPGYELIPDVRNDPVSIIISLVIGVALTAIGALLAPKPQEPKTPPSKRTDDIKGRTRFAPQTQFDSVQDLAALGDTIPLVFARKGVRVATALLWSQMVSLGTGQQLRAMMLLSSGELEAKPDFAGYAIGDSLLENYVNAKIALYLKLNGGRIVEGSADRYSEGTAVNVPHADAFSLYWDRTSSYQPYFSGTRTPGTQTQFGCYSPMPNGTQFRLDYELLLKPKDADDDLRDDIKTKRAKIAEPYARWCAVTAADASFITYTIAGDKEDKKRFKPWGMDDVNSFTESERYGTDENIVIGDSYMVGGALATGYDVPVEPWLLETTKVAKLRVLEPGPVDVRETTDKLEAWDGLVVLRVALGTVSNNRLCTCTEIGLKSTVFKQITGFPNVNAHPSDKVVSKYQKANGSYQLGSLTKYVFRLSFFELQIRPLGSNAAWQTLTDGQLFCVRNNSPQPVYNFIRINHPYGQYEYRFRPYPGNLAWRNYQGQTVWELTPGTLRTFVNGVFTVAFAARPYKLIETLVTNKEWVKGEIPDDGTGVVTELSSYAFGTPPDRWVNELVKWDRYPAYYVAQKQYETWGGKVWVFRWNGDTLSLQSNYGPYYSNDYRYIRGEKKKEDYSGVYYQIIRQVPDPAVIVSSGAVLVTGGSGTGLVLDVTVFTNGAAIWSIVDGGYGYYTGDKVTIPGTNIQVTLTSDFPNYADRSFNKLDAISDIVKYGSERNSHDDNPEHEIVYVNEQLEQTVAPQYGDLALLGIRINSTKEWSNFSSLSAYVKKGCKVDRLTTSGRSATNLLPEIAVALLTDPLLGAGNVISKSQVDLSRMTIAARFCEANGFTWDGIVADKVNLRQWIYEQAGFCMLDFTILGGQFSLVPSVPYGTDYKVAPTAKPAIKALFTDGNIRDLQVSFLSPEERKLFKAVLKWRQEKENGFPQTRTVVVRLANGEGGSDSDPEEQFDMSGFCTTQEHPIAFAKYALRVRQKVDHGLQFKTTPQAAMGLAPGDYFRLVSEATHTSRFNNGTIGPDGAVTCKTTISGSTPILYWVPGTVGVAAGTLSVSNGYTTQSSLFGSVFTVQNTVSTNRVYKVESLSYAEDGLVDVTGSYEPLNADGSLAVLNWSDAAFVVETG